jgi:hypothetical protein
MTVLVLAGAGVRQNFRRIIILFEARKSQGRYEITAGSDYDLTDCRATASSTLTVISRSLETCPMDLGLTSPIFGCCIWKSHEPRPVDPGPTSHDIGNHLEVT